ncbi:MAG: LLM class F420-dependent oxidoreductase [Alphaproteobacteria bacterium]
MHIGVLNFVTHYGMRPDELGREVEARGFESLFLPEHTHIPASLASSKRRGRDLPSYYWNLYDPFVALSYAAAATTKLKLGTGICLLPQRDTFTTAKTIASLDHLSGGRFICAIGGGWNIEEMNNHGVAYADRFPLMKERVLAMKAIWTQDEAEYHGEMIDFDPIWSFPKPVQKPHPPVLIGGETDHTIRRVVDYADGWFPRPGPQFDPVEGMARFKRIADEAGRDMKTLSMTCFRVPAEKKALESYAEVGVERVLLELPAGSRDDILRRLDEYAPLLG